MKIVSTVLFFIALITGVMLSMEYTEKKNVALFKGRATSLQHANTWFALNLDDEFWSGHLTCYHSGIGQAFERPTLRGKRRPENCGRVAARLDGKLP